MESWYSVPPQTWSILEKLKSSQLLGDVRVITKPDGAMPTVFI
jgi:hypothetical protein